MVQYFKNDPPEKDVDLIYNFVNSLEPKKHHKIEKLPNDPVAVIFTTGVSFILAITLFNMIKKC